MIHMKLGGSEMNVLKSIALVIAGCMTFCCIPAETDTVHALSDLEGSYISQRNTQIDDEGMFSSHIIRADVEDYFLSADPKYSVKQYDSDPLPDETEALTLGLNYHINNRAAFCVRSYELRDAANALLATYFPDSQSGGYRNEGDWFFVTDLSRDEFDPQKMEVTFDAIRQELLASGIIDPDGFYGLGQVYEHHDLYIPYLTGYLVSKNPDNTAFPYTEGQIREYIDEHDLPCSLQINNKEACFEYNIVPNEKLDFSAHLALAIQIWKDLGVIPYAYDDGFKSSFPLTMLTKDNSDTQELYGLAFDLPADTLHVGETRQILADWDGNCYLAEPLVIQSKNNDIAAVYPDGHLFANKPGTASLYIRAKLDPEKVDLAPDDDGIRTVTATITVADDPDLTDAQQTALEPIEIKEKVASCHFPRAKAESKGLLSADAPRLTRDEIDQMIAESDSFEVLFRKITDAQPYPDYYGGSGFTSVMYLLNDKGTERIRVMLDCGQPPHQIIYERLNQNGIDEEACYLYPESRVNEAIAIDPTTADRDWFYSFMNDIPFVAIAPTVPLSGDATCDNSVDVCDAVLIARFLAEDIEATITDQGRLNADYNADGDITPDDVILILKKIARLI